MRKIWKATVLAAHYPHAYTWMRDFMGMPVSKGRNSGKGRESDQFTALVQASGLNSKKPVALSVDDFGSITLSDE